MGSLKTQRRLGQFKAQGVHAITPNVWGERATGCHKDQLPFSFSSFFSFLFSHFPHSSVPVSLIFEMQTFHVGYSFFFSSRFHQKGSSWIQMYSSLECPPWHMRSEAASAQPSSMASALLVSIIAKKVVAHMTQKKNNFSFKNKNSLSLSPSLGPIFMPSAGQAQSAVSLCTWGGALYLLVFCGTMHR